MVTLIFLRCLCGYAWFNVLTLSPLRECNTWNEWMKVIHFTYQSQMCDWYSPCGVLMALFRSETFPRIRICFGVCKEIRQEVPVHGKEYTRLLLSGVDSKLVKKAMFLYLLPELLQLPVYYKCYSTGAGNHDSSGSRQRIRACFGSSEISHHILALWTTRENGLQKNKLSLIWLEPPLDECGNLKWPLFLFLQAFFLNENLIRPRKCLYLIYILSFMKIRPVYFELSSPEANSTFFSSLPGGLISLER